MGRKEFRRSRVGNKGIAGWRHFAAPRLLFIETLERRVLLSAWGVQFLGQLQDSNSFAQNSAASAPVVDSHGDVFVWQGSAIFELAAGTGQITAVADLDTMSDPAAGGNWAGWGKLFVDQAGDIYGYRSANYPNAVGEVFKIDHATFAASVVMTFDAASTGGVPFGVTVDDHGNIFGVIKGSLTSDSVFEVRAGSGVLTTLNNPAQTPGWTFSQQVAADNHGNVYGVSSGGGNSPIVYEIKAGSGTVTALASFDPADGLTFYNGSSLIVDPLGNVYGTSENAVVFEVAAGSGDITAVATSPAFGLGSIIADAQGNVFGKGEFGDSYFEIAAGTHDLTTISVPGALSGSQGMAVDATGNIYSVGQTFYFSLPWGPATPPSIPTLFRLTPLAGGDQLVINAPGTAADTDQFQVSVQIVGPDGNPDPNFNDAVTLLIASGPSTQFNGTLTVQAVNGVATFAVNIPNAGDYTLAASAPGMPSAFSQDIAISGPDAGMPVIGQLILATTVAPGPILLPPVNTAPLQLVDPSKNGPAPIRAIQNSGTLVQAVPSGGSDAGAIMIPAVQDSSGFMSYAASLPPQIAPEKTDPQAGSLPPQVANIPATPIIQAIPTENPPANQAQAAEPAPAQIKPSPANADAPAPSITGPSADVTQPGNDATKNPKPAVRSKAQWLGFLLMGGASAMWYGASPNTKTSRRGRVARKVSADFSN